MIVFEKSTVWPWLSVSLTVVQDLEQNVENILMGFFDLVQEHHRIGTPAHRFGQLASLFVADVTGRRSNETAYGVFLHKLAHVETYHGALVVKQHLRK